jgi:hypothetical protein
LLCTFCIVSVWILYVKVFEIFEKAYERDLVLFEGIVEGMGNTRSGDSTAGANGLSLPIKNLVKL